MSRQSAENPLARLATAGTLALIAIPANAAKLAYAPILHDSVNHLPSPESKLFVPLAAATVAAAFQIMADYATVRKTHQFNNPVSQFYANKHPDKVMNAVLLGGLYGYWGLVTNPLDYGVLAGFVASNNPAALSCLLATHHLSTLTYSVGTNVIINFGLAEILTKKITPVMEKAQQLGEKIGFSRAFNTIRSKASLSSLHNEILNNCEFYEAVANQSFRLPG